MFLKKITLRIIPAMTLLASATYADPADWNGTFQIKAVDGKEYSIIHTPTMINFMFFRTGGCLKLGKGATINGLTMPETINICTKQNVDEFSKEIEKFSKILNEKIDLGPNYTLS